MTTCNYSGPCTPPTISTDTDMNTLAEPTVEFIRHPQVTELAFTGTSWLMAYLVVAVALVLIGASIAYIARHHRLHG